MGGSVNAHLRRTFYLFVAGFVGLVMMLVYWQVYSREALANNPENGFQTQRSISSPRGLILAGDGETVLAKSVKREHPDRAPSTTASILWASRSQTWSATGAPVTGRQA